MLEKRGILKAAIHTTSNLRSGMALRCRRAVPVQVQMGPRGLIYVRKRVAEIGTQKSILLA